MSQMTEPQMTEPQMDALANLVGELKLSPVIAMPESIVDKDVDVNIATRISGMHRGARYPGRYAGGKKYIQMSGGGICENNGYVNMAVNSAIVMSGTAVALGAGYGGYAALAKFMDAFKLKSAVQDSVRAIYHVGIAIGKTVGVAGASAASGARDVLVSAASGAIKALPAVADATRSLASTGAMAGPFVAFGRYVGTEQSARDELQYILSHLEGQYTGLTNKIGTVTRSMVDKKLRYANEIYNVRLKIEEYNNITQADAEVATENTIHNFKRLKTALCRAIDTGINAQTDIANIFNPYYGIDMNIAFGGKRRKSVRGSNSRNSRSTSKGRKSGKQSKKMKGKRGKKSVKRSYSKR